MQEQAMAVPDPDDVAQAAVLEHVLAMLPVQLRETDLTRELARDPDDFAERDLVLRAIRDLIKVGLLFRSGAVVLPTPAAARSAELDCR
jgi:hypothetical protein